MAQVAPSTDDEASAVVASVATGDNGAIVMMKGATVAVTAGSDRPKKPLRLAEGSYLGTSSTYFDDDDSESAPAFYLYVHELVKTRNLLAIFASLAAMQFFLVLSALGLGQLANCLPFTIGCALCTYGTLQAIWREDVHFAALKPWSRSFYAVVILHWLVDSAVYMIKEFYYDNEIEKYGYTAEERWPYPFQPIYIACEITRKVSLGQFQTLSRLLALSINQEC